MKRLIREWSFPAVVLVAWMAATVYTVSELAKLPVQRPAPTQSAARNPAA